MMVHGHELLLLRLADEMRFADGTIAAESVAGAVIPSDLD